MTSRYLGLSKICWGRNFKISLVAFIHKKNIFRVSRAAFFKRKYNYNFFMLDEIFHIFGIQKYIAISFIYIFLPIPYALAYRSANKILMYIAKGKKTIVLCFSGKFCSVLQHYFTKYILTFLKCESVSRTRTKILNLPILEDCRCVVESVCVLS